MVSSSGYVKRSGSCVIKKTILYVFDLRSGNANKFEKML